MSFESFLSDPQALRDRGEWYVELYLKSPSGATEILRFSRRGTPSGPGAITLGPDTIPAHTPYKRRLIRAPSQSQSLWQGGRILSSSLPSFGSIRLANGDRGLDLYNPKNGYIWSGSRCKMFFFDIADPSGTMGKVFDGTLGNPSFSYDLPVEVPLRGREALFDEQTSTRVYRGTSYMLELIGDRTVSFGAPSALNTRNDMTAEGWIWIDVAPTADTRIYGWTLSTGSPWAWVITAARKIQVKAIVGGVEQILTSTTVLGTQKFYHFAHVISGRDLTLYFWDEDNQTLTKETFLNAFSQFTRDSATGTFILRTAADATLGMWFDDMRVWNVARTQTQIEADRHRPLTSGSIPASCVQYLRCDDGSGTTVTDSSATAANGTISGGGTSAYYWAMEGGPELAGHPKPDVSGKRFGVRPVLVDPIRYVYQVAGGGSIQSIQSHEGGSPHTMAATAASMRAFLTTTPGAGTSLPYLARGYFRLNSGSPPTLPISATVEGYKGGPLGYVSTGTGIVRDWITRRGPKLADPADLDVASFNTYPSQPLMGVALYQPRKLRELLDYCMLSSGGWWGYLRASTQFHVEKFLGPGAGLDYNFDQKKIIDIREIQAPVVYEVVIRYKYNDVVLNDDQVAASIKGTTNWTQWKVPYQEKAATDEEIRKNHPGDQSIPVVLETGLYNDEDAQSMANSLLGILKGRKNPSKVDLTSVGLQVSIGEVCTIAIENQRKVQVLGYDGETKYIVLSVEDNRQEGVITVEVWG